MSHTSSPIAEMGLDGTVEVRHIAPFWAVTLAGRDSGLKVNMHPGETGICRSVQPRFDEDDVMLPLFDPMHPNHCAVVLPYLTNEHDLAPGELLVMETNPPWLPEKWAGCIATSLV